jgi:hypothetical protein
MQPALFLYSNAKRYTAFKFQPNTFLGYHTRLTKIHFFQADIFAHSPRLQKCVLPCILIKKIKNIPLLLCISNTKC